MKRLETMKRLEIVERLKRRTDFRAAARAARAPAKAFVLQARRRDEAGPARVGFTVSRQVGNAVERNRVRRRLRETVRLGGATQLSLGHDYVLIGRRSALGLDFGAMMRDFEGALRRVHAAKEVATEPGSSGNTDAAQTGAKQTGAKNERSLHKTGSAGGARRHSGQRPKPH